MNLGAPYRVAVTVCSDCKRGWQHGGGAVELMSPAAVERAMCDAQWIGDLDSNVVERARQEISPATRRKVLHRDQARCQAPGCRCFNNLDVHHIVHLEHGGTNEMRNLITLCEAHHLAHHEGTLVIKISDGVVLFKTEGRNNFTRVTREVATRAALRERGYERDLVAEIMRRTISHIGATDLSDGQWLEIALRYADEETKNLLRAEKKVGVNRDRGGTRCARQRKGEARHAAPPAEVRGRWLVVGPPARFEWRR